MPGTVTITGIGEAVDALRAMAVRLDEATARATEAARGLVESKARSNLALRSHRRGTPTPSPPGQPPALIDGTLRDSFRGTMPTPTGDGGWVCTLSTGLVYSRIQELGGWAGRGHRSHLPPRPYLAPAAKDLIASGALRDTFARYWADAMSA